MIETQTVVPAALPVGSALEEYWSCGLHPDSPVSFTESNAANRLLRSARDAFATKGYQGTTTRNIAEGAGMSPAAMYIHYASKQEMLFKLSMMGHRACLESLEAAVAIGGGPRKRLRAAMYDFTFFHAKHHVISRTIQYDMPYLESDNYEQVADVRRAMHRIVQNILKEGVIAGDFKISDVSITTLGIPSMAIDTVRWFPSRSMSDPDKLAAHYASLTDSMVSGQA